MNAKPLPKADCTPSETIEDTSLVAEGDCWRDEDCQDGDTSEYLEDTQEVE